MRIIASNFLIDNELFERASQIYDLDNSIDIYLHTSGGNTVINGGVYGEQIIILLGCLITGMGTYGRMV